MGDEDRGHPQVMLSCWGHNETNRANYTLENMQKLTASGFHVHFCNIETPRGERGTWFEITDLNGRCAEGFSPDFMAAFWAAKDDLDFGRGDGPGNSVDSFESDARHSNSRKEQQIGFSPVEEVPGGAFLSGEE